MSTLLFTNDAHALIMACSYVGLNPKGDLLPLTLKEWNALAAKLVQSQLKTPGGMLGLAAETLQSELEISLGEAQRLAALLERGAAVAFELENLTNAGIRIVTRADEYYSQRRKKFASARRGNMFLKSGCFCSRPFIPTRRFTSQTPCRATSSFTRSRIMPSWSRVIWRRAARGRELPRISAKVMRPCSCAARPTRRKAITLCLKREPRRSRLPSWSKRIWICANSSRKKFPQNRMPSLPQICKWDYSKLEQERTLGFHP